MHSTVLHVFSRANQFRGAIGEIPYSHFVKTHVIIVNNWLYGFCNEPDNFQGMSGDSRLQGNSKTRLSDLRDNEGTDSKC